MSAMADRYSNYPSFMKIIDIVSGQNPLQAKRIRSVIDAQDERYWNYAENLCKTLGRSYLATENDWVEAGRSYNRMCMDFLQEQIRFRKTGVYRLDDAARAYEEIYNQPEVMNYYLPGILLSLLFWKNHYIMLRFLQDYLATISIRSYLEIAPGHGLFTVEALNRFPQARVILLDISQTSLNMTRQLLKTFDLDLTHVQFILGDFLKEKIQDQSMDFIAMGEVLEHVNEAPEFMRRAYQWLRPGGTAFMTTCANCPAIDHVYHFHNISEIRGLMQESGFDILKDIVLPAEEVPEEKWQEELVTLSYAAILQRPE